MKKQSRIVSILIAVLLSFTACVSDVPEQKNSTSTVSSNGISDDFDWSNSRNTQLTVNVEDQYNGQFYYTIEIYLGNSAIDANAQLISGGKSNKKMPYTANIVIPNAYKDIYILQTDPFQRKRVYSFEVEKGKMNCNLNQTNKKTSRAFTDSNNFTIPSVDYTIPGNVRPIKDDEQIKAGNAYIVESGNTLSIKNLPGEGNFSLYVAGTVIIENNCTLQNKGKIFVLNEGKVVSKANKTLYCVNNSRIAVDSRGILGDNSSKLQLSLTDYAALINEGNAKLDEIKATSGAQIFNNGNFEVKFLSTTDNTTKIVNTKDFNIENSLTLTNGIIYNACVFKCEDIDTNGGTINLASGSILESKKIKAGGLKLNMDALSMMECENLHFSSQMNYVTGSTDDFALILAKNIVIEGGGLAVQYSGKVEIKAELHTENGQWQNKYDLIAPACFAKGAPSAEIPKGECNDNKGNVNPGESGNPDTDPDYEEVQTLAYTYIFEDNWPAFGDYDMNDLVMSLQISNKKKGNKTIGIKYKAIVYAVGAAKPYGAAFQLDGISAGNVNNSESGQTYAVIRLFDEVHDLFGIGKNNMVNTYTKTKEPVVIAGDITFNSPIDGVISIDDVNPFIVWGGMDKEKRNEIHMPYYKGTDKAATSPTSWDYKYKAIYNKNGKLQGDPDYNNMMWALRIPEPLFAYPKEGVSIMSAYPSFKEWVISGGTNEDMATWYKKPNAGLTIGTGN